MKEERINNIVHIFEILNSLYIDSYGSNFVSYHLEEDKLFMEFCSQRVRNVFESFLQDFSFISVFVADNVTLEVWFL